MTATDAGGPGVRDDGAVQMPVDVLVVGDANPDLILRGDVVPRFGQVEQLLDGAELVLGGSASITAAGLARLGVRVALVSAVGDDVFGVETRRRLNEAGIDTSAVRRDPRIPTGLSVILSTAGDRAILTLPGAIPTVAADEVRSAVLRLKPRHVHVASYYLQPGLAAELPDLLGWLREQKVTTSLDTNWDPAELWTGMDAVLPTLDVLLPNREELRALAAALGHADGTDESLAQRIAVRGPRVVVKAGRDGGFSAGDGDVARAAGLELDVVDTTGAGDSFNAGYLAAFIGGVESETQRVRWAAVAGSLSTRAAGGTAAQATRADLEDAR